MNHYTLFSNYNDLTAVEIARGVWSEKDYTPEVKPAEKAAGETLKTVGNEGDLELVDYSEKAVAIVGNTREYVAKLKELGGAGWGFSMKREPELRAAFSL